MHEGDGANGGSLTPGLPAGDPAGPGGPPGDGPRPAGRHGTAPDGGAGPAGRPGGGTRRPRSGAGRRARRLLGYLTVAVLAAAAGSGTTLAVHGQGAAGATVMNDGAVYARVTPGIVDVTASLRYRDETAKGTGVVIDAAADLVLTNNHVINGAASVTVTPVMSGRSLKARVLGYDATDDIAVLRLPRVTGLRAVAIGNSSRLAVGASVLAIGNEAGQGGSPTVAPGVIRSLGRTIVASDQSAGRTEILHGMLQTSADIRPGDSGGPLADAAGRVIGINTAAGGSTVRSGYAIPITAAMAIARRIIAGRASPRIQVGLPAFLGALVPHSSSPDPRRQASQERRQIGAVSTSGRGCTAGQVMAVPVSIAPAGSGALVDGVLCGTPAAAAGLSAGDVIISMGGHPVTSPGSLTAILNRSRPGSRAALAWVSPAGSLHTALVTLAAGPAG